MNYIKTLRFTLPALLLTLLLSGCPTQGVSDYERGFHIGFMNDDKYWEGFDDSFDTVPDGPIWYAGSTFPYYNDDSYDAGLWDGIWYAYNDGYFVCYDYAFIVGFSEGYDAAYNSNWINFLLNDSHPEYLDGSFEDGYNDGFSEGSVFGAYDYRERLPFDWEDALWDYRDWVDIELVEVGFGTGNYGNVYLYEWGTDPNDFYKANKSTDNKVDTPDKRPGSTEGRSIRRPRNTENSQSEKAFTKSKEMELPPISYRALPRDFRTVLETREFYENRRQDQESNLNTSRTERVKKYQQYMHSFE